jgi:hypothetical protein
MSDGLLLEFEGIGVEQYRAVNQALGIDPDSGEGEWPEGLIFHTAGTTATGLVVYEVWESQEAQGRFMSGRLGRALQEGGINAAPSRVEWNSVIGYRDVG